MAALSIRPEFDQDQPGVDAVGYDAERTFTVKLRDPSQTSAFVQASLNAGANKIVGVSFRSSAGQAQRAEARRLAARDAKADLLAGELGAHVGPVRQISDSAGGGGGNLFAGGSADSPAGDDVPGGKVELRVGVSATFALRDWPGRRAASGTRSGGRPRTPSPARSASAAGTS